VFVVGCLGDSRSAAEVLFDRESVCRDTKTRRKQGKDIAAIIEASVDAVSSTNETVGAICAGTVGETLQDACTGRMIPARAPIEISRYALNQEVATTLSARDHKGPSCGRDGVTGNPIVTEHPNLMPYTGKGFGEWKVGVGTIRASGGTFGGGSETIVAYPLQDGREIGKQQNGLGIGGVRDPAYTVDCTGAQAVAMQAVSIQENGFGTVTFSDVSNPLTCGGGKPGQGYTAVMIPEQTLTPKAVGTVALRSATADSEDVSQTLITERACGSCVALQDQVQAVGVDLYNNTITGDVHVPLRTAGGHGAPACMVPSTPYVVRRLTPRECERLQGFPDDWTAIPFRGKPAADGPRYKALGNSMAVNCMEWIGERIAAYEARKSA